MMTFEVLNLKKNLNYNVKLFAIAFFSIRIYMDTIPMRKMIMPGMTTVYSVAYFVKTHALV